MPTDIKIAKNNVMLPITQIAKTCGFDEEDLILYGKYKAKISENAMKNQPEKQGRLVLVTAINPTPSGEGKTTITVGLGQALHLMKTNAAITLREPSLGPVFGVKGGAAGGGYSQVVPMDEINLHFTGDLHAITAANNLLCALIDNHLHQGNKQCINPKRIIFKRVLDMNDRALRNVIVGLGKVGDGVVREENFTITVASEVMAIFCLASNLKDLKERLGNIHIAYRYDNSPVFAKDLKANGAMTVLLKEAFQPNLVQTLEHSPCFIHGGPFANIAHGCNSIRATGLALSHFDYCVTEAGFGSDLGAEKFLDIKCRRMNVSPSCIVLVATVRALKYNGGAKIEDEKTENLDALQKGMANLRKHIENMQAYNIPVVVGINVFSTDSEKEKMLIKETCEQLDTPVSYVYAHSEGGKGCVDLAQKVILASQKPSKLKYCYDENSSVKEKIEAIATKIYGADGVDYSDDAENSLREISSLGFDKTPICIAKTQYSLSDDPKKLNRPTGFRVTVKNLKACMGAGFVVVYLGDVLTMPGLPKIPAAQSIDLDENDEIIGLF